MREMETTTKTYIDVFEGIRAFLTSKNYLFLEDYNIDINYANLVVDTEIRPIDQKHVQHLVEEMRKEPNNINNLLNRTPIIGYCPDYQPYMGAFFQGAFIADGNHRLEAARLFNREQTEHPIFLFPLSFYILSNVPLEHKLILTSMAEEKAYQNKKPLDRYEIMKHTRFLLLKCPSALGVEPVPKYPTTKEQKQYGEKVVEVVTKFFHVQHSSLVLRNIWKAARISDEDFNKMYKNFPNLPSGLDVHDFDVIFNKYPLCPMQITSLVSSGCKQQHWHYLWPNKHTCQPLSLKELKRRIRTRKPEVIPSLKHYSSYNLEWNDIDHFKFIVGEKYYAERGYGGNESLELRLQNYLSTKKRNLRRFTGFEEKLNYLRRHFQEWEQRSRIKKKTMKKSKKSNDPNINNGTTETNNQQQSEEVISQTVVDNFITQLVQSKRESLAAFAVHYFLRPQNPEQPLPEFYFKYLKNDKFDFTKFPSDDGLLSDAETMNLDNFGHHTLFKEAEENKKVAAVKRKRKTATPVTLQRQQKML